MVVYQNSLVIFDYAPDTDILSVDWPSNEPYVPLELHHSLQKLLEIIRSYDVKNLLINAGKAKFAMNAAEYRAIIDEFVTEFGNTRLQKFARITSSDPVREEKIDSTREAIPFPYQYQHFKTKAEALQWLTT